MKIEAVNRSNNQAASSEPAKRAWTEPRENQGDHHNDANAEAKHKHIIKLTLPKRVKMIERRKTILSVLVTNKQVFGWVCKVYTHNIAIGVIVSLWFLCNINSILVCFRRQLLPTYVYLPLQGFLSVNYFLHHSVFIRVDLVKEIMSSFNFWFTLWNAVSFNVCCVILWGANIDFMCAVFHSMSSILLMILYDSHAGRHWRMMRISVLSGSLSYIPLFVIILLRLVDFESEHLYYGSTGIEIVNYRLQALDNLTTLVMYLLRIIYYHFILKMPTTIAFVSHFYEIDTFASMYRLKPPKHTEMDSVAKSSQEAYDSIEPSTDASIQNNANIGQQPPFNRTVASNDEAEAHRNSNNHQFPNENSAAKDLEACRNADENSHAVDYPNQIDIDDEKYLIVGILESKSMEYDKKQTLYHRYLKRSFPRVALILSSKAYNVICVTFSVLGLLVSLPLGIGVAVKTELMVASIVIVAVGMTSLSIQMVLTCNTTMLRHIFFSFDYLFLLFLSVKTFVASGILSQWDVRILFWLCSILSLNWFIMVDTFSFESRKFSYISAVGIAWSFAAAVLCKLNIGQTFAEERYLVFQGIQFMASRVNLSTSILSADLFLLRFLWSYHKNPRRILFITENVRVEKLSK